jgi:MFS family permease
MIREDSAKLSSHPHYKWLLVGMLWWISFFNYADRQALSSVFPLLSKELHLDDDDLSLLGTAFAWVYGLGAPFAGIVVDRVMRKKAILAGLHIWSIICMATALSRRFWHLFVFRAAEGLGETFYYPASVSMISDYHGQRTRSRALGIHQTSVYIGTIAGGFFAGLIGQYYGWQWSFLLFGGAGVLLGIALNRFLIEPARGAAEKEHETGFIPDMPPARTTVLEALGIIMRKPTLALLLLAFMCANAGAMILLFWMPRFLYDKFGFGLALAGLNATLYPQLASMVGSPLGGWLADSLRKRTHGGRILVQAGGVLAVAPFAYACGQAESIVGMLVALTFWGLFKGIYDANIFASAFDVVPPEARGTVAGLMNMFGWLAGAAPAPLLFTAIKKSHGANEIEGMSAAISSASVVYVVAGILLLIAGLVSVKRDG